jgi:DNA-binding transcriptional LysR family regulator
MRFHEFDLNLLVYLDALLSEQSVSKAAARAHIGQPAMSLALARLRSYFGDELLVYVEGRRMVLTSLAQELTEPIRNILNQVQAIAASPEVFCPAQSKRRFSIMGSDYVIDILIKRFLPRLLQDAPEIQVEMRRLSMDSRVQIKRADLDLLIAPYGIVYEELPREPLWTDTTTGIVWSKNPFVLGEAVSEEQYLTLGHVCASHDYISPTLRQSEVVRTVQIIVPDLAMVPRAVEGTNRIAFLHRRQAQLYVDQCSLRLVKPPIEFPIFEEFLQWHPLRDRDPGLFWFRNYIKAIAAEF